MNLIGLDSIKYEINRLQEVPHILISGARGTGKTTLARYISHIKNKRLIFTTGNTLKKIELLNIFINIQEGDILLIDEIHRLSPKLEEILYQPMENFMLPVKTTYGEQQQFKLPKFSLIGTTTKPSMISKPLMSRFQLHFQISHYNIRELARIIMSNYSNINRKTALKIAVNVVTPREAINLAYRCVNLANKNVNKEIDNILEFIGYKHGLSKNERFYLKILYNCQRLSQTSLCSALQVDKDELSFIEDKLLLRRLIEITNKGRQLTFKGLQLVRKL